ncbi:hypothetical protein RJ40_00720 [Methanofollis aquaemaris]|uniref:Filamentation induced by cAMP protein Fic-like C-terminal domain-containing protein n=1 Tax=Methanofollis aquaemaris TaxID=126734 RepID=A0A8A3S3B1_9EURY|nr:hypothetical protein RJ40_00720 [Methanofollis aquaemaris]
MSAGKNRTRSSDQILRPLLDAGPVKMTIPEKPGSGKQRYRATEGDHASISRERGQFDTDGCIFLKSALFSPIPNYE